MAALVSGWALIVASPFVGILPGPGGIPVFLAGLVIVLRNSHGAHRLFAVLQRHRVFEKIVIAVVKREDSGRPSVA